MKIVFQGDSLTDCNRRYEDPLDLGDGYVAAASKNIASHYPNQTFIFLNRGVSGDRTWELLQRWQKDTIDLQPDILTLMIGVNDTWRRYDSNDPTSPQDYEYNLRRLLDDVKSHTQSKILMIEPFLAHEDTDLWREDFTWKLSAFRRVSRQYANAYLPMDGIMAMMCVEKSPQTWSEDGIHLIQPGIERMGEYVAQALFPLIDSLIQ